METTTNITRPGICVNGGTIRNVDGIVVEVLGPANSNHEINMVCVYMAEGARKCEMVYDGENFYIYKFKRFVDTQHYWSTKKDANLEIDNGKYRGIAVALHRVYNTLFIKRNTY